MKALALEKLGLPGIAGIGLLLFCLFFYFGSVSSAQENLASLETERAQLAATAVTLAEKAAPPGGRGQHLRPISEAPELLKQLNALAEKDGVTIARASYEIKEKEGQQRLQVSMPLRVGYPSLRAYLIDALALSPSASLDELSLQRTQASDAAVEAQVRLSYGFAAS